MDETALRLEVLKLAAEKAPLADPEKTVEAAEAYWGWLITASDHSVSPRSQPAGTPNKS